MTTHATIDIETLGTSPDTVVLTIGGIKFDPMEDDGLHSRFYYRLAVSYTHLTLPTKRIV